MVKLILARVLPDKRLKPITKPFHMEPIEPVTIVLPRKSVEKE